MKFTPTRLDGVWIIDLDPHVDDRGFFARSWCQHEFAEHGLNQRLAQCNIAFSPRTGTLRGMHYQVPPHEEVKLVRVTRGAIFDVTVDLRPESPTAMQWISVKLTADNRRMVYIAEGIAHGYQTLEDDTEVFYQMSEFFHPDSYRGIRWNDPAVAIQWPAGEKVVSERDNAYDDIDVAAIRR